jgi:hypothetical protein
MMRPWHRVSVEVEMASVWMAAMVTARWELPLAAAPSGLDRVAMVYGGIVSTASVGFCTPTCSPFILRCVRGDSLSRKWQAPPIKTHGGAPSILGITFPDMGDRSPPLHYDNITLASLALSFFAKKFPGITFHYILALDSDVGPINLALH